MATETDLDLLRLYVADERGEDEKFHDIDLSTIVDGNEGDLFAAAAEVWGIKAGNVAHYYAVTLDSSSLNLGQMFTHCQAMAKYYRDQSGGEIFNVLMSTTNDDENASEFG